MIVSYIQPPDHTSFTFDFVLSLVFDYYDSRISFASIFRLLLSLL